MSAAYTTQATSAAAASASQPSIVSSNEHARKKPPRWKRGIDRWEPPLGLGKQAGMSQGTRRRTKKFPTTSGTITSVPWGRELPGPWSWGYGPAAAEQGHVDGGGRGRREPPSTTCRPALGSRIKFNYLSCRSKLKWAEEQKEKVEVCGSLVGRRGDDDGRHGQI
ncbi:uncharacterized protein J3D65DRAFT_131851 [Phyllosticta citribraziliensis]|uniref:Uncharacterized protein n=1 Tax=Phyllosticta citribraziliensis TaxID=989973 RepID=A0ABR1L605_9PEZI